MIIMLLFYFKRFMLNLSAESFMKWPIHQNRKVKTIKSKE
jgi:hypothetical protein